MKSAFVSTKYSHARLLAVNSSRSMELGAKTIFPLALVDLNST